MNHNHNLVDINRFSFIIIGLLFLGDIITSLYYDLSLVNKSPTTFKEKNI